MVNMFICRLCFMSLKMQLKEHNYSLNCMHRKFSCLPSRKQFKYENEKTSHQTEKHHHGIIPFQETFYFQENRNNVPLTLTV